jgi:hypothetical protein
VPFTGAAEAAMRRWLQRRPPEPGRPPYAPSDYGLDEQRIDERFADYNSRFRSGATPARRT